MKGFPHLRETHAGCLDMRPAMHGAVKSIVSFITVSAVVFFLVKADIYLFLQGLLPVTPSALFLLGSLPLVYCMAIKFLHERRLPPAIGGCGQVLLPFAVLAAFGLVGILVRYPHIPEDTRPLFFPVLDLYVFLVGVLLGGIRMERRIWKAGMVAGLLVTIVTIVIDVFLPHTFTLQELEGPSGLAQNPNGGAYVALLLMIGALNWEKPALKWQDIIVFGLGFSAILLTVSRSGILAAAVAGLVYLLMANTSIRRIRKIRVALTVATALILILPVFAHIFESIPVLETEPSKARQLLNLDTDIVRFGDIASLERMDAVNHSIRIISEATILGMGTGYVYGMPVGPHNMYLARWVDNGLIGMLSYLWLIGAALAINWKNRNPEGAVISLMVLFFGFFSHNVLEDRTVLLLLAISTSRYSVSIKESVFSTS